MTDLFQSIGELGIVPVVAIDDAAHAVPLAKALAAGGLPVAEITFRTAAAEESIRRIASEVPEVLVGAGTVLTPRQVDTAVAAGAKFIVSPGVGPRVVDRCRERGVPITPGVATATDIALALEHGLGVLKFFPAETVGGLAALKALAAPYHMLRFIPTGGISAANLNTYLAFDKVVACGGSWMVKKDLIAAEAFDRIEALVREAVDTMLGFDLAHVGINADDAESSLGLTKALAGLFGLPVKEGNSSNFAGTIVEVLKSPGLGDHGHIAIRTNSVARAMAHLRRRGVDFDPATAKGPEGGPIKAIYLDRSFGGFAIHLLQA